MSDNNEVDEGHESISDPESMDDLFLSPDDSQAVEIPFETPAAADVGPDPEPAPPESPTAAPEISAPETVSAAYAELEAERDDYRNRMMRVAADLENFRKRTAREKEDTRKYGIDRVVLELLPVLDNLERALDHADKSAESTTIVDGIRMVQRQFVTALEKHGVQGYDSKGEHFDPQRHEAIQQIDTEEHPTGHVLDEYQKGYYLHERLIRPALVVVARNPSGAVSAPPAGGGGSDEAVEDVEATDSEPSDGHDESAVN